MTNALGEEVGNSFIELSASDGGTANHQRPVLFLRDTYTCFALLDVDFNFITVNAAYARAQGQSEEFFPGKNHFDLYPSDAQQIFEEVRKSKKPSRITAQPVVPPGQPERHATFWDWTVSPILNQQKEVEALILAETDVTRRVRTEQALFKSKKILAAINHAQDLHNPYAEPEEVLDTLLAEVIDLTESEYGFIGEVIQNADGQPHMKIQTILNFSRQSEARQFSVVQAPEYLDFTDPDTLFGKVISSGKAVICNDPANDPRSTGLPEGHPALHTFLGMPFDAGEILAGAIGVANCADGYDEALLELLQPLLKCYMQLIHSNVAGRERLEALTSLGESTYLVRDLAIPAVENEHSELIGLINECYDEMDGDADAATIRQLFEKTYSAVAEHFLHEEQLMRSTAYPEYEAHRKHHEWLLATLRDKIDRFVESSEVHILQNMLANWFGRHFSTFDLRLHKHLAS